MPPKQATLGYVKSKQQTLGCMIPALRLLSYDLANVHLLNRKFFGQSNGVGAKPQQSTLAFQKPKIAVKDEEEEANGTHDLEGSEGSEDVKSDVVDGDAKMDIREDSNVETTEEEISVDVRDKSTNGEARRGSGEDSSPLPKRSKEEVDEEEDEEDDEPVRKRPRRSAPKEKPKRSTKAQLAAPSKGSAETNSDTTIAAATKTSSEGSKKKSLLKEVNGRSAVSVKEADDHLSDKATSEAEDEEVESDEEDKPEVAAKAREKVQSTLKSSGKDPYPDWKSGEPVPYAALCTTFSLIEMTTKRLVISSHCSLFLRQVLRLTPQDLLPTVQLMINKLAADYAGIELGIGESLIMKAIGESTGRSLQIIKADQNEIGDLGLVAAKSRSNQPTMFKPKPLTVRGVLDGLMGIATVSGDGSQGRKIAGIKKLLSAADAVHAGKGNKGIDISKDKGGASEAKFIIRFLEGKLRLGLAEKTVLVALAHAMVVHETEKNGNKLPSSEKLAEGEAILKTVYR